VLDPITDPKSPTNNQKLKATKLYFLSTFSSMARLAWAYMLPLQNAIKKAQSGTKNEIFDKPQAIPIAAKAQNSNGTRSLLTR